MLKNQHTAPQVAPIPTSINPLDFLLQQHQIMGAALIEIKQMDERLTNLENGYDATTVQKARLYEEMLKVDEKTGVHLWHLRLRDRMRALGMNQTRLSFLLGVNPSTVCRWVKGTAVPSLDMLERIGLAMGLSLIEFLSPDNDLDFTSPDLL